MTISLAGRLPQQLRSALVAIESDGFDAAADDCRALETLRDSQRHINPRQAALRALLGIEVNRLVMARDLSDARNLARVIREHLGQYFDLEAVEDERTYTDALPRVAASYEADRRVIGGMEMLLGIRQAGGSEE